MTRDEIIATAKRAGFTRMQCNSIYNQERLARLIFNVAAAEREACAQVCLDFAANDKLSNYGLVLARRIRERGEA